MSLQCRSNGLLKLSFGWGRAGIIFGIKLNSGELLTAAEVGIKLVRSDWGRVLTRKDGLVKV